MKITVIGGGSTYTPELVSGLLARRQALPVTELCLMDNAPDRLEVVGSFIQRMIAANGAPFRVTTTDSVAAAVDGASYVVTQVRVGGMEARRRDEYLGRAHGIIGQETTGVGGMAKAMRTIPVILDVARHMQASAPDAILLNFANPAGLVSEALNRYTPGVQFVGVCNGPYSIQRNLLEIAARRRGLVSDGRDAFMKILGLNHLSWSYGMTIDGDDVWPTIIDAYLEELDAGENGHIPFDYATIEALNMVPSSYLQYFYDTARRVAAQDQWPPSRAEVVMGIEGGILEQFRDPALVTPPADLMKRGGAYYSTVATQFINAHYNDLGETYVMNVRHDGAVAGWPADWVLEMPCRVDRAGAHPVVMEPLPPVCYGLMTHVKMYELLTVEAAVHGDRRAAHQALLAHPLAPAAHLIPALLRDLFAAHADYLPQFAREAAPA